jgi:AcrR family transcriptional regulator
MTRKYELGKRADRQQETRNRILDATVALHTSVGPARTTVSAIAERAGVQRHTVYAHFPDEEALFAGCSAHWAAVHPFPDAAAWEAIADPRERLQAALGELYAWYRSVSPGLAVLRRDATLHPIQERLIAAFDGRIASMQRALARGFAARGAGARLLRAALGHALAYETWESLAVRGNLDDATAAGLSVALVDAALG